MSSCIPVKNLIESVDIYLQLLQMVSNMLSKMSYFLKNLNGRFLGFEYASCYIYAWVLNIPGFWTWHGFEFSHFWQGSEYGTGHFRHPSKLSRDHVITTLPQRLNSLHFLIRLLLISQGAPKLLFRTLLNTWDMEIQKPLEKCKNIITVNMFVKSIFLV